MKEHMNKYKSEVGIILADLERDLKRDKSVRLANYIQNSIMGILGEKYSNIEDRGVKGALFFVLFGANMPSILAEVSFISNPIEERLLKKETYRNYIANAISKGIDTYLSSVPQEQRMAERK